MPVFERVAPYLQAAIEYNGGETTLAQVYAGIQRGEYMLIPGRDCAIVLEPVHHPSGKRVLNFFLAGGDLKELQGMERDICVLAKEDGFDAVAIFGRRGWLKRLNGYTEQAVYMEKAL